MASRGEPERALFFGILPAALPAGYSRLYFGAEFCPSAFPPLNAIERAIALARQGGCAFTLAIPVLHEPFLPRLREILTKIFPRLSAGDEILINDFGAIRLVRELAPAIPLVLGRVLSGQKRGPQILDLQLAAETRHYFRQGSWYAAEAVELLREMGIERVEIDNLLQGMAPLPATVRGTLHHPFAMVASSRNCPFRRVGEACGAACGEGFSLTSPASSLPLLQAGNSQFIRIDPLPENPAALGIDRLVFHPFLPR